MSPYSPPASTSSSQQFRHVFRSFESLPTEIALQVASYLACPDLLSLTRTNKKCAELAASCLWRSLCLRNGAQLEALEKALTLAEDTSAKTPAREEESSTSSRSPLCDDHSDGIRQCGSPSEIPTTSGALRASFDPFRLVSVLDVNCNTFSIAKLGRVCNAVRRQLTALRIGLSLEGEDEPIESIPQRSGQDTSVQQRASDHCKIRESDRRAIFSACDQLREIEIRSSLGSALESFRLVRGMCRRAKKLQRLYLGNVRLSTRDVLDIVLLYPPGQLKALGLLPVLYEDLDAAGMISDASDMDMLRGQLAGGLTSLSLGGWGAGFLDLLVGKEVSINNLPVHRVPLLPKSVPALDPIENPRLHRDAERLLANFYALSAGGGGAEGGGVHSPTDTNPSTNTYPEDALQSPPATLPLPLDFSSGIPNATNVIWKQPGLPNLREFSASLFHPSEVAYLAEIAMQGCLTEVLTVTLRGLPTWGDGLTHLALFLAGMPKLRRLVLPSLSSGSGHILTAVMPYVSQLESLHVGGPLRCWNDPSGAQATTAIAKSRCAGSLKTVQFESGTEGDEMVVAAIVRGCPMLTKVVADYRCTGLTHSGLCAPTKIIHASTAELGWPAKPAPREAHMPQSGASSAAHQKFVEQFANLGHDSTGYQITGRERLERVREYGEELALRVHQEKAAHIARINSAHRQKNNNSNRGNTSQMSSLPGMTP